MSFNGVPGREIGAEKKTPILFIILFLNLTLISSQIILRNRQTLLHSIVWNILTPFQVGFEKSTDFLSAQFKRYVFLKNSYQKYQGLRQRNLALKYQNYLLRRGITDQRFLQGAQVKFGAYLPATVISVDSNFPRHTLTIDKGQRSGVKENMTVVNPDGDLVGKVALPISPFTATVRLITSSIGGCGAYVGQNYLEGFFSGRNSNYGDFKYLLGNKPAQVGDWVQTSGTDLIYPPFLPIGKVVKIKKGYPDQFIEVRPFFIDKPVRQLIVIHHE